MKTHNQRTALRLPMALYRALREEANKAGISMSAHIRKILEKRHGG